AVLPTIVTLLLTRSVYYTIAYHVFHLLLSRENFNCLSDFIHRRFNSIGLANVSATLMLAYEICQLVLMYNQTAREMSSMIGSSFQFWLVCLSCITFCMAVCGTGSLVKICLLIYGLSIIVYFWIFRFLFVMEEPKTHFAAWQLKSFETRREQAMSTPDTLLYESNIICSLLAAPLLHTASRLDQTEYTVYQPHTSDRVHSLPVSYTFIANRRFAASESLSALSYSTSLFALRAKEGCDQVAAGISCHYGMLSKAMTSHASLKALYPVVDFLSACWLGGVKVVATAHAATRSRMMRSFRWAHMTRWRRQNGLILFRGCRLIDLQIYVYNTFIVALTWCTLLFCLDNLPLDPSVLKVQFANYLILDLRFMIFLNATLLGLTFRRLSRSVLYWILALSRPAVLLPDPVGRHADRRHPSLQADDADLQVPRRLAAPELLQENPAPPGDQRRPENCRSRGAAPGGFRRILPDHRGLTWYLAASAPAACLNSQLAVLKSPIYCIGDLASVNFARRISSGLVNWVAHLLKPPPGLRCSRSAAASAAPAARNPCLWRRLSKNATAAAAAGSSAADASASTGGTGHNVHREQLVREKYTREETELVLSSLAEAGLRQRLIDGQQADERV
uniref:Lipase_3 domain-containing protein n=1 Tax=Macrostomum lignano TaxID=282301 RepID=A0A1I8FD98_9PLAT